MTVANTPVRQDPEGRYCLNDLHRISGGAAKDQPAFFFARKETASLVAEIDLGIPRTAAVSSSRAPGPNQGTYVCKQLVYAYAMWISAKFHLQVINVFYQYVSNPDYGQVPVIKAPL